MTWALEEQGVRYLVTGGLAVNAHGYLRFTKDVDLVIHLVPESIVAAFRALASLGYRPMVPIGCIGSLPMRQSGNHDSGETNHRVSVAQ